MIKQYVSLYYTTCLMFCKTQNKEQRAISNIKEEHISHISHIEPDVTSRPPWRLHTCWRAVISSSGGADFKSVSQSLISPPVGEERKIQYSQFSLFSSMQRPACQQDAGQINVCLNMRTSLMSRGCLSHSWAWYQGMRLAWCTFKS